MWRILLGPSPRDTGEWDVDGDAQRREYTSIANDGIISSAAIIQGLLTAGATGEEAVVSVSALIAIGMVTAAATAYSEAVAERNSKLAIVDSERRRLEMSPQEEFEELVEIYERKGLSHETAATVAQELTARDALAAQLDAEFDIADLPPASLSWRMASRAALAFLVGSLAPLLILLLAPWSSRGEITVVAVSVSLVISAYIGSRSEHSSALGAIGRTLLMGFTVLGISVVAGRLVTF